MIHEIVSELQSSHSPLCKQAAIVIEHLIHCAEEYEDEIYFKTLTLRALEDELGYPHSD
jgi:hypothetical protein